MSLGTSLQDQIAAIARAARQASRQVARAGAERRTRAIVGIADAVERRREEILAANAEDVAAATTEGLPPPLVDRLTLDEKRLGQLARAVREVAALPDPVGQVVKAWTRPNGLRIERRRLPLGVIAMIYESRPNVTTDAAALCLRAGNVAILRGGSEAFRSNQALGRAVHDGLAAGGLPPTAIQLLPTTDREAMGHLLEQVDHVDVVIPRGGEALIRYVTARSRIPVLRHDRGNCHVYVHGAADEKRGIEICYNAKVQRPSVCNAAETILVDASIAPRFLPLLARRLGDAGVELRGDERARAIVPSMTPATAADFDTEFLELICAVAVVDGLDQAIAHIERHGSSHSEAIVTEDPQAAARFLDEVHSSTVLWNASTRFADGGELGLGAEIGISTSRLHAYGPMGADELTTSRFVVLGEGQVRS